MNDPEVRQETDMANNDKTNVMRILDKKKISYEYHTYTPDATLTGEEIAGLLGEDTKKVFKTLITRGRSGQYYVFVVPVCCELDLKKAAGAAGEKSVEKGVAASDGICPWRMLPGGHEKRISHIYP